MAELTLWVPALTELVVAAFDKGLTPDELSRFRVSADETWDVEVLIISGMKVTVREFITGGS